ncbi:MAG: class I SAM-dependent methyltransferase [Candidatus Eisenbacteria bacterium]|nr:class I SAM-dependent methyltransferase [Candidatus Eisenbacteria bacterium]
MKTGGKAFYDYYWKDQAALSCDEKCRLHFILSELDTVARREAKAAATLGARLVKPGPKPGLTMADVGCGRGWLTDALSHFGRAVGFDQSTVEAARRYPHLRFVECDVLDLKGAPAPGKRASTEPRRTQPPQSQETRPGQSSHEPPRGREPRREEDDVPGLFDLAVSSEVIEHVRKEDQPILAESISKILREDGTLILTTPNRPVVDRVVSALGLQDELQPVEDWLDAGALSRLLQSHFEVLKLTTLMFFPVWVRRIGPLSRIYRILYESWGAHKAIDPLLGPTLRGLYLGVVARKRATLPLHAGGGSAGGAGAGAGASTKGAARRATAD